jgi:hypothetical protein
MVDDHLDSIMDSLFAGRELVNALAGGSASHQRQIMLALFALRAPKEPAPWFVATMPTPRPKPLWMHSDGTLTGTVVHPKTGRQAYQCSNSADIEAWDTERARRRGAQWPWASAVLDARHSPRIPPTKE